MTRIDLTHGSCDAYACRMNRASNVARAVRKPQPPRGRPGRIVTGHPAAGAERSGVERCAIDLLHAGAAKAAQRDMPSDHAVEQMTALFALLAVGTRLRLVLALRSRAGTPDAELCVCDLATVVDASESLVSHQLRLLREAGIVTFRRDGKLALYRLAAGPLSHLVEDALEYIGASRPGRR